MCKGFQATPTLPSPKTCSRPANLSPRVLASFFIILLFQFINFVSFSCQPFRLRKQRQPRSRDVSTMSRALSADLSAQSRWTTDTETIFLRRLFYPGVFVSGVRLRVHARRSVCLFSVTAFSFLLFLSSFCVVPFKLRVRGLDDSSGLKRSLEQASWSDYGAFRQPLFTLTYNLCRCPSIS